MSNPTPNPRPPRNINNTATVTSGNLVPAVSTDIPEVKNEELNSWLASVYNYRPTEDDFKQMIEALSYKGFNRVDVLKQLTKLVPDPKTATELIIVCALRGPQAASRTALTNGRTPAQMGIPASGGKGTKKLTCNRISSATADLAAFYLKRMNAPKRINMELPGWLQFPAAGSIKLPSQYRAQHAEFAKRFSEQIGGVFQEQIYMQMESNAYLNESLNLFSG